MATIVKKKSDLENKSKKLTILFAVLILLSSLLLFFNHIIYSIILFILFLTISSRSIIIFKGYKGEKKVFKELLKLSDDYFIFNDVNIISNNKKAQIDHIVVHNSGIWCIETKSHVGWIFGREDDKYWTQTKLSSQNNLFKNKFYSPVMQNKVHCQRLFEFLKKEGIENIFLNSVIIFTSAERLNTNTKTPIIFDKDIVEFFLNEKNQKRYSMDEKLKIVDIIANNQGYFSE